MEAESTQSKVIVREERLTEAISRERQRIRSQSPSKRDRKLEDWGNRTQFASDKRHNRDHKQECYRRNLVWWTLTCSITIITGFLLGLTILSLLDNVLPKTFARSCESSPITEYVHSMFTRAQGGHLKMTE